MMSECVNCKRLRDLLGDLQKEVQSMHNLIHSEGGLIDRLEEKDARIEELESRVVGNVISIW